MSDTEQGTSYFVGSGIAALAGAAFLIRDAKVDGKHIVILEESDDFGGALDAHGSADDQGSEYFEHERVEAERDAGGTDGQLLVAQGGAHPVQHVGQAPVRDLDRLGPAGRSRGEEDVRRVVGPRWRCRCTGTGPGG